MRGQDCAWLLPPACTRGWAVLLCGAARAAACASRCLAPAPACFNAWPGPRPQAPGGRGDVPLHLLVGLQGAKGGVRGGGRGQGPGGGLSGLEAVTARPRPLKRPCARVPPLHAAARTAATTPRAITHTLPPPAPQQQHRERARDDAAPHGGRHSPLGARLQGGRVAHPLLTPGPLASPAACAARGRGARPHERRAGLRCLASPLSRSPSPP